MDNCTLTTISKFAKEVNKHNPRFINLIINLLENEINNNNIILNNKKEKNNNNTINEDNGGYIIEKIYNDNKNDNQIRSKYERIGVRSFEFHKRFNDHKFHENCQRCNYNCKKYNYICAMTIPKFDSIDKHGRITQYSKCGWSGMENNCVHDCRGLYFKNKNTIVRFRRDILTGNFNDDYFIEKLYNDYNNNINNYNNYKYNNNNNKHKNY